MPVIIGPGTIRTDGTFVEKLPIISAGIFLSQPPSKMTESMGCAFIISSTHIDIKFLYIMEVGFKKVSPREIIGNTIGNAPLDKIPIFKLSKISGKFL